MNNKFKKMILAAAAILIIASGCSNQNNEDGNTENNAANNNGGAVVEQPDNSTGNSDDNNVENDDDQAGNEEEPADEGNEDANDAGTNEGDDANIGEVTAAGIADQVIEEVEMGMLLTLDDEQVKDMYGIEPGDLVEEGVFMPAMMNVHAYELTIVKLKADEHFDAVNEAMEQRALSIQKTFERYLQDQYEASKNYQILRQGDYVLFSITPDQEKVAEIFDASQNQFRNPYKRL